MEMVFAALLDLLADDLGFEIEAIVEDNEGINVVGLEYICDQMEKYCEWIRAARVKRE